MIERAPRRLRRVGTAVSRAWEAQREARLDRLSGASRGPALVPPGHQPLHPRQSRQHGRPLRYRIQRRHRAPCSSHRERGGLLGASCRRDPARRLQFAIRRPRSHSHGVRVERATKRVAEGRTCRRHRVPKHSRSRATAASARARAATKTPSSRRRGPSVVAEYGPSCATRIVAQKWYWAPRVKPP